MRSRDPTRIVGLVRSSAPRWVAATRPGHSGLSRTLISGEMPGMQALDTRSAVGELAKDLGWLEDHCRQQPALAAHAGNLRLASALARNVVGPFLEDQPAKPLHIAV